MQAIPIAAHRICLESAIRTRARFQIHSTCRFWWTCRNGHLSFGSGTTRNVSSGGVSIDAAAVPSVGAAVIVEIDLGDVMDWTGEEDPTVVAPERVLRVEGRVIRHEPHDGGRQQMSFAVIATQATIEAAPPGLDAPVSEEHYA